MQIMDFFKNYKLPKIVLQDRFITLVNTQIFATDIILILGYIRCVDFENDIHFC